MYRRGQWDLSMKGALSMAKRTGSLVRGRRHKQSEVRGKKCCRCRGQGAKGQGEQPGGCVQNNQSEFMRAIVLCRATAGRLLREEGGLATQTGGRPVTAAGHLSRGSLPSGLSLQGAGGRQRHLSTVAAQVPGASQLRSIKDHTAPHSMPQHSTARCSPAWHSTA